MPNSATACLLSHRGVLRVGGEDRAAFLQGLISNDIGLCLPDKPIHAALLTPQGKFLHEFFIYDAGDAFMIDCERADDLLQRLSAYKLRAKVTLENVSDGHEVWASLPEELCDSLPLVGRVRVGGERLGITSPFLKVLGKPHAPSPNPSHKGRGIMLSDPRLPALGMRGVFRKNDIPKEYDVIESAAYDRHRLALGVTDGSRDLIVGKSTLLDGNFDLLNGISWTKGCYVGQELTARMHHRALIKKRMFPVRIEGIAPAAGANIFNKGVEIGEMRSSSGDCGLALLNIEQARLAIDGGDPLECGDAKLMPYWPEWMEGGLKD